jgi:hypothetical protein
MLVERQVLKAGWDALGAPQKSILERVLVQSN